jgi:(R,R)-butanediol dehydrogenase/meso-butanediol dehydrogenase/diacetyl reductase
MRAAVVHGTGDIRVEERDTPEPRPGELLIKVTSAGICGTDAGIYAQVLPTMPLKDRHPVTGHLGPLILGHEFAGEVVAAGEGASGSRVGSLTVCGAGVSCGECRRCRQGRTNLCERYTTLGLERDGGLAEFVRAPAGICVDVDELGLTADTAALAQPMAIAVHAVRRGRVGADEKVVVIGAGGIGAFAAYVAAQLGAEVTVIDIDPDRLAVTANLGVARTVQVGVDDGLADGITADVVLEVSGTLAGFETATGLIGHTTRVVQTGIHRTPRELDLFSFTFHEAELIGTIAHVCAADLPEAVDMLGRRKDSWSDVAPIVLGLDELVSAGLEPMKNKEATPIKTLVDPGASRSRPAVHSR